MTVTRSFHAIDIPGKFDTFLSGSGVGQGQCEDGDERDLYARYRDGVRIRRGRGYTLRIDGLTIGAVAVLAEQADTCIVSGGDDGAYAEGAAARKVYDVCVEILTAAGWVLDGYYWRPATEVTR